MEYIFIALILYSIGILFGAMAARNIDSNLASAIMNTLSAIVPIIAVIPILNQKIFSSQNSKFGIIMAVLTGIALGLFAMALNKSYSLNKVAIVAPIVFGGAIFLSAILSSIFFKEKISNVQGIGLILLALSLSLITYARITGR